MFTLAQLLSLGYNDEHAWALLRAQFSLSQATTRLDQCKEGPSKDVKMNIIPIIAYPDGHPDELLPHDDILLPWWEKFVKALSSVSASKRGYIRLALKQVKLGNIVSGMLLESFETAPLASLILMSNDLGSDGIQFVVSALKITPTIKHLCINSNHFESDLDAISLVETVNEHPRVDEFLLDNCGIGENHAVMAAIVPTFKCLRGVFLRENSIGSHGATLIAKCLAGNPAIKSLILDNNLLEDKDAIVLSYSLKTNTNLQCMGLRGNQISQIGFESLTYAVTGNIYSLNAISDSNHTCNIDCGEVGQVNTFTDSILNRKWKFWNALALQYSGRINANLLNNFPLEITPKVLDLLQGKETLGVFKPNDLGGLNAVFLFMREWSMPLLYTSCIGLELRRSEHIRKMIMHYLGK